MSDEFDDREEARIRNQRGQYAKEGETCEHCKFWAQEPSWFKGRSEGKSCRRYPPHGPFVLTREMMDSSLVDMQVFLFPPTYADAWCGEFQPAKARSEAEGTSAAQARQMGSE